MERLGSTRSVRGALSKPQDSSWREAIARELIACALHFRTELSDADLEIYAHGLRDVEVHRVQAALARCLRECEFMPKLYDIFTKMPEKGTPTAPYDAGKVVREWDEPYVGNSMLHWVETEDGAKRVRIVTRQALRGRVR